jgi:hypothetical protein
MPGPDETTNILKANHMQIRLNSLIAAAAAGLLTLGWAGTARAADATGTWTWTMQGRGGQGGQGGQARQMTLKLKAEGDKLTGTLSSPGRQGGQARETAIDNGKVSGEDISFSVTREFNGNKMTSKYSGKVSADTIKGKVEMERNGEPVSRDWEAKREGK